MHGVLGIVFHAVGIGILCWQRSLYSFQLDDFPFDRDQFHRFIHTLSVASSAFSCFCVTWFSGSWVFFLRRPAPFIDCLPQHPLAHVLNIIIHYKLIPILYRDPKKDEPLGVVQMVHRCTIWALFPVGGGEFRPRCRYRICRAQNKREGYSRQ